MFANGRIEEFLIAKTLTPPEMSDPGFVARIAATLRRLHQVPTDGKPTLWPTILRWLDMARELLFDDPHKREQFAKVDFAAMRQEVSLSRSTGLMRASTACLCMPLMRDISGVPGAQP